MLTAEIMVGRRLANRKARKIRAEKALSVAHGAWADFGLQLPGDTVEQQNFNVESCHFLSNAWLAFCREYSNEVSL